VHLHSVWVSPVSGRMPLLALTLWGGGTAFHCVLWHFNYCLSRAWFCCTVVPCQPDYHIKWLVDWLTEIINWCSRKSPAFQLFLWELWSGKAERYSVLSMRC